VFLNLFCWHRPGRLHGKTRLCRNCGVGIEECPCAPRKRNEPPCPCCEGSEWVAIVRSRKAAAQQAIALFGGEIVSYYMRFLASTDYKGLARLVDACLLMQTAKSLFHIAADACTRINGPETKDLRCHLNSLVFNGLRVASLYLLGFKHVT
jgi:hypothetical protein